MWNTNIQEKLKVLFELTSNLEVSEKLALELSQKLEDDEFLEILKHTKFNSGIIPNLCKRGMYDSIKSLKNLYIIEEKEFILMLESTNFEMIEDYRVKLNLEYENYIKQIFLVNRDDEDEYLEKLEFYKTKLGIDEIKDIEGISDFLIEKRLYNVILRLKLDVNYKDCFMDELNSIYQNYTRDYGGIYENLKLLIHKYKGFLGNWEDKAQYYNQHLDNNKCEDTECIFRKDDKCKIFDDFQLDSYEDRESFENAMEIEI